MSCNKSLVNDCVGACFLFSRAVLSAKFRIRLSTLSAKLLADFLQRDENLLLASIINDKVNIVRLDIEPIIPVAERKEFADNMFVPTQIILPNYSAAPVLGDTAIKHNLSVPGKSTLAIGDSALESKTFVGDKLQEEWLKHIIRPQVLLSRKRKVPNGSAEPAATAVGSSSSSNSNSSSSTIVGGEGDGEDTETPLASALEPTILFSTVMNAADSLVCLHISSEARQVVGGFKDHCVRVWYLDEGNEAGLPGRLLGPDRERSLYPYTKLRGSTVIGGTKNGLSVDRSEKLTLDLYGHTRPVYGISQDATARFVVSASGDETVRLWDTAVAQCIGKYTGISPFWGVSFSPLGYYFATANQDKTAALYSTDRPQPLRLLTGHVSDVTCVDWHQNNTLLASGSDDRTCRLWDIRQANTAQLLQGCPTGVNCVSCSRDGRLLAAGTAGGSVHVWDLLTGKALGLLVGHTGSVHTVAFSEDTAAVASGGADCSVRVWSLEFLAQATPGEMGSSFSATGVSSSNGIVYRDRDMGLACSRYLLNPLHTFNTKYTPVYYLGYTSTNMMFGGGPFAMSEMMS
jgi:WD40 repeat protein